MSYAENILLVSKYQYKQTPNIDTAISYVVSVHKETNRQKDEYSFWVDKFGIVDPHTNRYVHDLINIESHFDPYLGLVENSIIYQTDSWSIKPDNKMALWFSTELKKEGKYPDNKLVISYISESPSGQKKVENIMVIFECTRKKALELAKLIAPTQTEDVTTTEQLRSKLLDVGDSVNITDILKIIAPFIPQNPNYKPMTDDDKRYLGQLIVDEMPATYVAEEMARRGVIGKFRLGCISVGQTYSNYLEDNSLVIGNSEGGLKYVKNCGKCGAVIETFISSGYICKSCGGEYKGC